MRQMFLCLFIADLVLLTSAGCNPPCKNGGECKENNFCSCSPYYTGDRCQNAVYSPLKFRCNPPCENGGECKSNNFCSCSSFYSGGRCQNDVPQCGLDLRNVGISRSGRVGGNSSSTPAWPWMAAVHVPARFLCAGSIIHRHFILTSAFCVKPFFRRIRNGLLVKLSVTDLRDRTHLQEYNVRKTYMHPLYKYPNYNIALLELKKPIDYNLFIRPVCLPPAETPEDNRFYKPQTSAHVIRLDYNRILRTHNLNDFPVVIQPPDICHSKFRAITDRMFCATHGRTPCPPNRTGGIAVQPHRNEEGSTVWTQVGIISKCKNVRFETYLFFTHIQKMMPWVNRTIGDALKTWT